MVRDNLSLLRYQQVEGLMYRMVHDSHFGSPQPPYDPLAPPTPPYYGGPTSTSQMTSSSRYGPQEQTEPSVRPKVRRPQEQPLLPTSSLDPFDPNVSISEYIASQTAPTVTRPQPQPHPHGILTVTSRRRHPAGDIGGSDLSQRMSELSFGALSTPPEQIEPSVRPKVRTPLQPTGSPPPPNTKWKYQIQNLFADIEILKRVNLTFRDFDNQFKGWSSLKVRLLI